MQCHACCYFNIFMTEIYRNYSDALEFHRQALILCPQNPSTLSAIGYIHSLLGNNAQAVDYFHKVCTHLMIYAKYHLPLIFSLSLLLYKPMIYINFSMVFFLNCSLYA